MKIIKKVLSVMLTAAFAASALLGFSSCAREGGQRVDSTKTQINLRYYAGGLGTDWIDAAIKAFEEKYANYSFEEGKVGVQVMKDYVKGAETPDLVKGSTNHVYITENVNYYEFVTKDVMLDLTDLIKDYAATGPDSKESGKTIEEKISDSRKNFYNMGTASDQKYFALPYYESSVSLIYNVDLFDKKGWYLIDGKSAEGMTEEQLKDGQTVYSLFLDSDPTATKSAGPDGIKGTSDDGLPATYADFQALLTMIEWNGAYSFISNGYTDYFTPCATEIWATASGLDEISLSMSFEGKSNTLLELDANGNVQYDENGNLKFLPETDIIPSNAYMIHQQKGKLDAIEFVKMMMNSSYYADSWSPSFSHRMAQKTFINGYENGTVDKEVAMLVDGSWWNCEAKTDYQSSEERMTKKFATMPIPKPDASQVGENTVRLSERNSMMFINKNTPENALPAAKTFVSFLQSDEAMSLFSVYTDTLRAMDYKISDENLAKMSYYGRNNYVTSRAETTDWIDWLPTTTVTKLNASMLDTESWGFNNGTSTSAPFTYYKDNKNTDPVDYFRQIWKYYKNSWAIK